MLIIASFQKMFFKFKMHYVGFETFLPLIFSTFFGVSPHFVSLTPPQPSSLASFSLPVA